MAVESEDVEAALRVYASILGAMPLPAVALDGRGIVRHWNSAAEQLLGWRADEVIGGPPPGIPESEQAAFELQLQLALGGKSMTGLEGKRHTRSGEILDVRVAVSSLTDASGRVVGVLRIFEDVSQQKRTEEALRQSEERYRTLIATANEGIWLVDLQAHTILANERMAEMLGYTPEELSEVTVVDCTFRDDADLHRKRIGSNLEGKAEQFDTRFRRKDGSELLVLGCTSPVRDADGRVVGALGMFTDITERVQTEEERLEILAREQQARAQAEEAQQRLALLADTSARLASSLDYETTLRSLADTVVPRIADWCAVHLIDEDGSVRQIAVTHRDPTKVALARELEQRYPYDPDAPSGVPQVLRTGRPELVSEVPDGLLEALTPDEELLRVVRGLGFTSWMVLPLAARGHLLGALTLVAAESGRHYGPDDLALADILGRRAALAVDNARLYLEAQRVGAERSAILSQMTDGVILVDPHGVVTFLNDAAKRLYGRDFVGQSLTDYRGALSVLDPQGRPYDADALPLQRALSYDEVTIDAEARLHRPDGTEVIVERSATPVTAADGTRLGAVLTVRDVTPQRTLERQKEEFLSAAAHDLRTPLTSLKGMAQILQRRLARERGISPEQLREGLERIEQNASRMSSLINELLDLSRLQTGEGLELNRRPTDLVALASQSVGEYREGTGTKRISFQSLSPELTGMWDADRLERVIANLLSNATKYSHGDTPIAVTLEREEGNGATWAVLSVEDHGIGIPREDLPHIFERFRRARNVGSETLGTGIGLSGARQIVEQHGGTIDVRSEEGAGSTFTVRLPLASPDAGPSADSEDLHGG